MNQVTKEQLEKTVRVTKSGATVNSDKISKIFSKAHKTVLKQIRALSINLVEQNYATKNYFKDNSYLDNRGKTYPRFELTRKGFDLLVLGFTGKEALKYKLWYIDEFHKKSEVIKEHKQIAYDNQENPLWLEFRGQGKELRTKLTDAINDFELPQRLKEGKSEFNFVSTRIVNYSRLIYKVLEIEIPKGTNPRDTLDIRTLVKLEALEERVAKMIENQINKNIHYKEVYQNIKIELSK